MKISFITSVPSFCSLFPRAILYFHFLWDHGVYCCILENGVLLLFTLVGVSSVANFITAYEESPIFYVLCVLCFQR